MWLVISVSKFYFYLYVYLYAITILLFDFVVHFEIWKYKSCGFKIHLVLWVPCKSVWILESPCAFLGKQNKHRFKKKKKAKRCFERDCFEVADLFGSSVAHLLIMSTAAPTVFSPFIHEHRRLCTCFKVPLKFLSTIFYSFNVQILHIFG